MIIDAFQRLLGGSEGGQLRGPNYSRAETYEELYASCCFPCWWIKLIVGTIADRSSDSLNREDVFHSNPKSCQGLLVAFALSKSRRHSYSQCLDVVTTNAELAAFT